MANVALGEELFVRTFTKNGSPPPGFVPPTNVEGPRPEPDPDATQAAIAAAVSLGAAWDRKRMEYIEYLQAEQLLTAAAFASVPESVKIDPAISPDPLIGYLLTKTSTLVVHMHKKYGTPTLEQQRENAALMRVRFNPLTMTVQDHIGALSKAFHIAEFVHSNPVSQFDKVEYLRDSMVSAPRHLLKVIDDYNRAASNGTQTFLGPDGTGLAPKLIAAAERSTNDLAGATGFAGGAAHEYGRDSASAAECARLKKEVELLTNKLEKLEKEKKQKGVEKKCVTCHAAFTSHNNYHVTCKTCWNKNPPPRKERGGGGGEK